MAELIPTTSEAEWLEARRKGITASEIAVVMGLSPYSSPYALWHQKLGILPPPDQTEEQEVGHVLEPYIARKFAERHPEFAVLGDGRELWRRSERPWQMATPDRTVHELVEVDHCTCGAGPGSYAGMHEPHCGWELDRPVAVLECKSDGGSDEWGEPGTAEIPVHYRCQVLWQMDVMGLSRAYVACLGRDRKVREYVVEHDPAVPLGYDVTHTLDATGKLCDLCTDILAMRVAALDLLDRIDLKDAPGIDYHPATGSALRALYAGEDGGDIQVRPSLAISYAAAVKRYKAAERRKDEMTNAVLEVLRDNRRAIDPRTGDSIATRSVSHPKRIDVERLRSEQPAIAAEYTKPPKPEVKLTPAKPKKES